MVIRIHLILYLLISFADVYGQQPSKPASLKDLLQLAETNYPLLKSKTLEAQAAQRGIDINKSSFIPSLDASYQVNYATYNNITGMAYPQYLVPISGPPSASNNMNGVFGSATSLLLNWQPLPPGPIASNFLLMRNQEQFIQRHYRVSQGH